MSVKYGNPSATYNIPLNSSENDIFRIGCAHLQHFLHINLKTDDCKPMILKMHLELAVAPLIGEAEQRNIQHNNSSNGLRQTVQQLEEEMKALKQAMNDVINRIDKAPDVDNNATQESNSSKQAKNENNLNEEHNDTEKVASASAMPEMIDLRDNCVYIRNYKSSDASLERAYCNILQLAKEMTVEIPKDSIIHIDVKKTFMDGLYYLVHFCDVSIKEKFLKNRHFYVYHPKTSPMRIFDYSEWGIVDIKNIESSDMSLETAYVKVIELAKKMRITNERYLRDCIDHIDVYESTKSNFLNYSLRFNGELMRKEFLRNTNILKRLPETKSLEIYDVDGHRLSFRNVNNIIASANVIGLAQLIGLSSLAIDNLKRIYVLNNISSSSNCGFSLIVEFSSQQIKDEYLEKKQELIQRNYLEHIQISNINNTKNTVLIKYVYGYVTTAISFFGLAKQLDCSLTPDQIQHFIDLSKFIEDENRSE